LAGVPAPPARTLLQRRKSAERLEPGAPRDV